MLAHKCIFLYLKLDGSLCFVGKNKYVSKVSIIVDQKIKFHGKFHKSFFVVVGGALIYLFVSTRFKCNVEFSCLSGSKSIYSNFQ